jgi:hypothetical protein
MIAASLGIKQTIGRDLAELGHYSDLVGGVEGLAAGVTEHLWEIEDIVALLHRPSS